MDGSSVHSRGDALWLKKHSGRGQDIEPLRLITGSQLMPAVDVTEPDGGYQISVPKSAKASKKMKTIDVKAS
ncbi:hypothetical protein [Immundisolibacter sp.]|uniref:hypothetical protein n=1 Tax=Immundisolibacter sp. TaxID=1934948 RepID=UPI003F4FA9F4